MKAEILSILFTAELPTLSQCLANSKKLGIFEGDLLIIKLELGTCFGYFLLAVF